MASVTRAHNIENVFVQVFQPALGTSTGVRTNVVVPCRGQVTEVGFVPNSLVASAMTMAVSIGDQTSTTASTYTQFVTSTLGTFASTKTLEGLVCSVVPATTQIAQCGDILQFTTSGGDNAAIGGTVYAVIRRG